MVRRHQPYTRAHLADDHPLAVLESLNNHDKHREIRPALFLATDYKFTADPRESECRILELIPGPDKDEPLHVDAVLAYIRVADRDACKDTMHVKTQITAYVCIGDRLFLDDTLSQIDGPRPKSSRSSTESSRAAAQFTGASLRASKRPLLETLQNASGTFACQSSSSPSVN